MRRAPVILLALMISPFAQTAQAAAPPNLDDAPLRAVQFADASVGWAAGDGGVMWYTIDGGKTWERQPTGTRASLRAVHFLTPYTGWAVGRVDTAADAPSQGVVLSTTDGGGTWQEVTSSTLPGLNAVRFFDEKRGVVCGDGTGAFPTGVFATADGGQTWLPAAGPRVGSWLGGAFTSPTAGVVGGAWGRLMLLRDGKLTAAELDPLGGRAVRAVVADGGRAVAACDGGRILTSSTNGVRWGFADLPVPEATLAAVDFRCVAAAGGHVWAAGRPGSVVLHSPDFGKTWDVQKTGQPTPIHALHMHDARTGWAVGDLGTILATADGGQTWAVRKCGGLKAGVLFAHAKAGRVPLGPVAAVGGRDGYLAAAVTFTGPDPATADPTRAGDEFRLSAAVRGCGGAAAESLGSGVQPDRPADDDTFTRRLVLTLRTWRPDVVVGDPFPPADASEKAVLVALQEAFKKAADPAAYPDQIEHLGLAPHAAKKLYALSADAPEAPVKLDLTLFAAALADSPRDAAEPFAALVVTPVAGRQCFRLLSHRVAGADTHESLTDGVELAAGGAGRRAERPADPTLSGALLADRENAARARRQLEAVALNPESAGGAEKALAHVAGAIAAMPDDMACRAAVALGRQFAADGRWTAAREMYALAVEKYPAQPDSAEALRWLARFYASSEVRRRIELGHHAVFQKTAFAKTDGLVQLATHAEPALAAKQVYKFSSPEAVRGWNQSCLDLEPKLAAFGAGFARDPATNLSLLAARRQLGLYGDASTAAAGLVRGAGGVPPAAGADPWRDCLAAELWLGNPQSVPYPPKPVAVARRAAVKPLLDGKLDDECWKNALPLPLTDVSGATAKAYPTRARIAADDGFLYVAVECGHPDGLQVPTAAKRGYDADLRGHDRVELVLDLDRDYQTYFRFQIDHRGCVADDCWGDKGWNPKWFAAVEPSATGWTAEVAIPMAELTGVPPGPGQVWAANVTRTLPSCGLQAWSQPAGEVLRTEGLGLLQFQAAMKGSK